jgi:hypothetical protein
LYCRENLNLPVAEQRLNRLLETPLTQRGQMLLDAGHELEVDAITEELRNALWLLWSLQPNRYRRVEDNVDENLLELSDDELRTRCEQLHQGWTMTRLVMDEPVLCLPSSGTVVLSNSLSPYGALSVPIADVTWAVPVSPRVAFIAHPRGSEIRDVSPRVLVTRSAGHDQESVVIAPALLDRMTEDQIRHAVTDSRRINVEALRGIFETNAEIQAIAERFYAKILGPEYAVLNVEPIEATSAASVRHFYVREPSDGRYSVEFLMQDQAYSIVVAKFSNSWSMPLYAAGQPRFQRAEWAHDDEVSDAELRRVAGRAMTGAHADGYVMVVHAPGRIALVRSDKVLPSPCGAGLDFNVRAEQPVTEGAPPPWWPTKVPTGSGAV